MINELQLETRINNVIMATKYHFLKSIKKIPRRAQKAKLNSYKNQYFDEGDIGMFLLADCLSKQVNLDYIRQHNYFT